MGVQRKYDRKIATALERARIDAGRQLASIEGSGIGAIVRDAQLRTAMTALSSTLATLFRSVGAAVDAGREEARAEALMASFDWDEALLRRAYRTQEQRDLMRLQLLEVGRHNVEAMIARLLGPQTPLSTQVYKTQVLAEDWLSKRIGSAIGRGEPPAGLAKDVRDFVDPRTRGGATYAANRLARTEINNAYHSVAVIHAQDKPWNVGMKWCLSKSHKSIDPCDSHARLDHAGLGAGIFPLDGVPGKPHPQCFCYVVPQTISIEAFLAGLRSGEYDAWMNANYGV